MKVTVVLLLAVLCLVDSFTTIVGLYAVLKPSRENPFSYVYCVAPALAILALLLCTPLIWEKEGLVFFWMKWLWGIALLYDFYTALAATAVVVILGINRLGSRVAIVELVKTASTEQLALVLFGTILIVGSCVLLPYIIEEDF